MSYDDEIIEDSGLLNQDQNEQFDLPQDDLDHLRHLLMYDHMLIVRQGRAGHDSGTETWKWIVKIAEKWPRRTFVRAVHSDLRVAFSECMERYAGKLVMGDDDVSEA